MVSNEGGVMKGLLLATMAAVAMAAPVHAADMPLKAPPVAAAAVFSWTDCYVGVSGGGAWSREWEPNPVVARY